ncbi:MAG TPA: glycine betaine ABC transporter substrate-binding protein [Thermomicrobiales bacterium]|jgi:osmoprotectant transport system substrate-binding protein|nr:glycine betaine ABC transporter substrate-binding protein [Thermomicrobiales bacterium]
MNRTPLSRRTILKGAAAVPVAGLGLAALTRPSGAQGEPVRVGSKDFPEQFTLGHLIGQALENGGVAVNLDAINLGGTGIAHTALVEGEIDVYPEYSGTAYTFEGIFAMDYAEVAGQLAASPEAATPVAGEGSAFSAADLYVYDAIVAGYAELGLTALNQTPFNNNQAIAVTRAFSDENGITTISELAEWGADNDITISAPVDFEAPDRGDGFVALQATYGGGFENATVNGVDPGLKYDAFLAGEANVVLAFGTDAEIAQNDLVVLQDDLSLFPPAHAVPVFRNEVIEAYPNIPELVNPVIDLLTTEAMISLNVAVVVDGGEPADVARQFLTDNGIITG